MQISSLQGITKSDFPVFAAPSTMIRFALIPLGIVATVILTFGMAQSTANPPALTPSALEDLVYANRILYDQGVLDAFGHVSVRDDNNPDRFWMSRSMAPALVTSKDILEFDVDGSPVVANGPAVFVERFIHAAIYRARPDVKAIVHDHSVAVIPFSDTGNALRPVFHMSGFLGAGTPIFDIQDTAGPSSDMLIRDNKLGDALAHSLGANTVVLLRGHGAVIVGDSIEQVVFRAYYTDVNARLQAQAMALGKVQFLSPDEAAKASAANEAQVGRPWALWKSRIGKIE